MASYNPMPGATPFDRARAGTQGVEILNWIAARVAGQTQETAQSALA